MTELFKNRYRISPARLQSWNYADNGLYFVTICIQNREPLFGNIVETQCFASPADKRDHTAPTADAIMQLSALGKMVEQEWLKTPELRPDMNLVLNEYVVMPNHFHAIIYIGENSYNDPYFRDIAYIRDVSRSLSQGDAKHCVSTSINENTSDIKNKFGPQYKNLASIIRGFKAAVTTYARKKEIPFNWQPRFHDHIIKSNEEYIKIADYIVNNPSNWQADKFYQ
ncbi:transposase [Mucilaginibacter antarcticus]|uniref:Transposase n=1 Tax=Mucilaginibacter antarcticus TaxID=1855725 RepID=A0ABW5XNZ1_9SPHI